LDVGHRGPAGGLNGYMNHARKSVHLIISYASRYGLGRKRIVAIARGLRSDARRTHGIGLVALALSKCAPCAKARGVLLRGDVKDATAKRSLLGAQDVFRAFLKVGVNL